MRWKHEHLRSKGWSEPEIQRAHEGFARAEAARHPADSFLEKAVFYGLLFLILVGVFLVSAVIIPLLLVFDTLIVAFITAILGLCLGTFLALLIPDIHWLEAHHHALAFVLLGVVAVVNVHLISVVEKPFGTLLGAPAHSSWTLGVVFALALLAPYVFHLLFPHKVRARA